MRKWEKLRKKEGGQNTAPLSIVPDLELPKGSKTQGSGRAPEAPLRQILVRAAFV